MSATVPGERVARLRDRRRRAARQALWRWAWRLFRREWRQQLLILSLVFVAVGATVVGSAIATNAPPPATAGFGTAQDKAVFSGSDPHLAREIGSLEHRFDTVDVIENQSLTVPGSVQRFELRAQDPSGAFGRPMLTVLSGRLPDAPDQVALTPSVASAFDLHIGDAWHEGGTTRRVVGVVENPQSLSDDFALVQPGQVDHPTEVTVLFDAHGVDPRAIGPTVRSAAFAGGPPNALNPTTISLGLAAIGMLLITLVAIGGFTVLAQRRQRSMGMLASLGATGRDVATVIVANGAMVGITGALLGAASGALAWLLLRPAIQSSTGHLIDPGSLPYAVIVVAIALAVLSTSFAAWRPARALSTASVVASLAGRPPPPRQVQRSAVPGVVLLAIGLGFSVLSGGTGSALALVPGLLALVAALVFFSPLCLSFLARLATQAPVALRIALRDLARYRARSASALAAVSLGVLIAVIISVVATVRYANPVAYVGPNLAGNQLIVYTPAGDGGQTPSTRTPLSVMAHTAATIAKTLGAHRAIELQSAGATLNASAGGRSFSGSLYVATPELVRSFGINPSTIDPRAEVLTMRPGLAGLSGARLVWGAFLDGNGAGCPRSDCRQNPLIQDVSALPSGTSAPNTVLTEHAVRTLDLHTAIDGWLLASPGSLSVAQINAARQLALAADMIIETKSSAPGSVEITTWATVAGVALALAILAMTIGLIRSETANDLRTLSATGATSGIRRIITATTACSLGLAGAVLGAMVGYVGVVGFVVGSETGLTALGNVPIVGLAILLIGMPTVSGAGGYLLGGREPPSIARQPIA